MIYDCATAVARGRSGGGRVAVAADFSVGAEVGFSVVCGAPASAADAPAEWSDGCRVVVTELFSEMKFQAADRAAFERDFRSVLADSVAGAADYASIRLGPPGAGGGIGGMNLAVAALFDTRLFYVGAGEGTLIHARRGDIRRLDPPPPGPEAAAPGAILRAAAGPIPLRAGDTLLSLSRSLSGAEERRAQIVLSRGRGQTADTVALSLLDAFGRHAEAVACDTAFCVTKLR